MLGSLLVALGVVTCTAAGGHCDSPSTQLRTDHVQQVQTSRQPSATVTDSADEGVDQKQFEQGNAPHR